MKTMTSVEKEENIDWDKTRERDIEKNLETIQ